MSKGAEQSGRETGRNRIASFLFSLLPATMILGLLAPDVVETQLVAAQSTVLPAAPERVAWQPRHFKTPLLVPNEILLHRGIDLSDVGLLLDRFAQVLAAGRPTLGDPPFADGPGFQSGPQGDTIVIDDVDDYIEQEIFAHSLQPGLKVDLSEWWPDWADGIESDAYAFGSALGYTLFDDLVGEVISPFAIATRSIAEVPEPASGALLALGLAALSARRRPRR